MSRPQQLQLALISHEIENVCIPQRAADGYINGSAMCRAARKEFSAYRALAGTEAFFRELADSIQLPIERLVFTKIDGQLVERGTWVHPDIAIHLGQWCSPKFAVAVSKWVREWMSGRMKPQKFPYHIDRYLANMGAIPRTHFSILNEMIFGLVGPMENDGYTLPERLVPDISEGKMFCKWLRDVKGVNTDLLPKYNHQYADGRVVQAKLYPLDLLGDFRTHFHEVWLPHRAVAYFEERDLNAIPYLRRLLLLRPGIKGALR